MENKSFCKPFDKEKITPKIKEEKDTRKNSKTKTVSMPNKANEGPEFSIHKFSLRVHLFTFEPPLYIIHISKMKIASQK